MRILLYTLEFIPFSGGIATYCYELACGLASRGHEVFVVAPESDEIATSELPFNVAWTRQFAARSLLILESVRTVRRVVVRFRPDVLLVTDQYALIGASVFGRLLRLKSVPIVHGSEILRHGRGETLIRRLLAARMQRFYQSRDLTICVSNYTRTLFMETFVVNSTKAEVVHNGMKNRYDAELHRGGLVRDRWDIRRTSFVLLTLARLVPRKGQDVVIKALPSVVAKCPDVVYLCAGSGPYQRALSDLAMEQGVSDNVIFSGQVTDAEKYAYYDACDLFVMPSRRDGQTVEGFGLSFLEAWHASKPVLGGRHGGVVELVEDGVDGVIVDPEAPDAVASAITSLIGAPSKLQEMGHRGHVKANDRYSDVIMADRVVDALHGALRDVR